MEVNSMLEIITAAIDCQESEALSNWRGVPVIRFNEDITVTFNNGIRNISQGIHQIVWVNDNDKIFGTKHRNVGIVQLARNILLERGYVEV